MKRTIHILQVTHKDLSILQEISLSTFVASFGPDNKQHNMDEYVTTAFSETKMKEELNHPFSQFYFAQINGDIVGYLKLNCEDAQTEPMGKDAMEIERIYVRLANQGMGIGQKLINFAKEKGREANLKRIWLGVWEENHRALQFYHRNGFQAFDSHIFTFGDEEQRDLLLEFVL